MKYWLVIKLFGWRTVHIYRWLCTKQEFHPTRTTFFYTWHLTIKRPNTAHYPYNVKQILKLGNFRLAVGVDK